MFPCFFVFLEVVLGCCLPIWRGYHLLLSLLSSFGGVVPPVSLFGDSEAFSDLFYRYTAHFLWEGFSCCMPLLDLAMSGQLLTASCLFSPDCAECLDLCALPSPTELGWLSA